MFVIVPLALCLVLGSAPPQRKTPAQLAQDGWNALNAGRAQEAAVAFDEALRGAPREPTVLLGAGVAAHLLGQPDAARRYLSEALKHEPALTAASLLLGETSTAPTTSQRPLTRTKRRWCTRRHIGS